MRDNEPLIEFCSATIIRGNRAAISNLSLTIARGESVAILGPNGCGKSTLIGAILREFYPLKTKDAAVRILGRELWNLEELRALIGIVKNTLLPPKAGIVSARELVVSSFFGSVGLWNHQRPTPAMWRATDEALDRTRASDLADRDIDELSSGEARRVEIARALAHRPGTLLLDEPANHLDPRAQAELRTLVRSLIGDGTAVIMVTHHVADVVPEIGRVILMRSGTIFADGPRPEILRTDVLTALFDHPIEVNDSRTG